MSRQATTGIQQLYLLILAVFAIVKHGAAINATTAGRTPLKIWLHIHYLQYDESTWQ